MQPRLVISIIVAAVSIADALRVEAREPAAVFFFETVDRPGNTGNSPSIDIDRNGMPHIGYADLSFVNRLRYAHRTATGWSTEDVPGGVGSCSFRLSADGTPFFAWVEGYYARAAMRESGGWRIEDISSSSNMNAIALGAAPDGSVHACALGTASGGIYCDFTDYANWQAGKAWTRSSVEWCKEIFNFRGLCSIAASSTADPHISLWNDRSGVGYIRKVDGRWVREPVGSGSWNSIALDPGGVPHIAFHDSASALRLGVREPHGWNVEVVDDVGDVGESCSLAIGAGGSLHIAYYDATRGDVKYAHRARGATEWTIQVVAFEGDVGGGVSLALDAEGGVHIAFYDKTHGELEYATTSHRVSVQATSWGRAKAAYR